MEAACGSQPVPVAGLALCDPGEPLRLRFSFVGQRLWLKLRRGDEFRQMLLRVDGAPANRIRTVAADSDSADAPSGRLPLLSPYEHAHMRPSGEWVEIHADRQAGLHVVEASFQEPHGSAEDGRSQLPILALSADPPIPFEFPAWPSLILICVGAFLSLPAVMALDSGPRLFRACHGLARRLLAAVHRNLPQDDVALGVLSAAGIALVAVGAFIGSWSACLPGLAMLAVAGLQRPVWWLGALLCGLPLYLYPLPLIPGLAINLIEIGAWGGLILAGLQYLRLGQDGLPSLEGKGFRPALLLISLLALTLVALLSALASEYLSQAMREWRSLFLASLVFACAAAWALRMSDRRSRDAGILLHMWILGAVAVSLFGYYAYAQGVFVTDVEGVRRIRGLYGSPNNLALYLDRTLLVSLAVLLLSPTWRMRMVWAVFAAVQAGAMLLTFSKGGLLLGVPAGLLALFLGIYRLRRQMEGSRLTLWMIGGIALLGLLALAPFLNTPRFAGLLDWQGSFTSLVRTHLWRSGWSMFLDNPLLGVGPDNFLYWYRGAYIDPAVWNEPSLNHPHNFLMDLASRLGLAGLLAGMAFFLAGFVEIGRHLTTRRLNRLALGLAAAGVGSLAHGMVDVSYALPDLMLSWILIFLLAGACVLDRPRSAVT